MRTLLLTAVALFFSGCTTDAPKSVTGKQVLSELQKTVDLLTKNLADSVVYVEVTTQAVTTYTGLVITTDGNILIPAHLKRDAVGRIRVWVGDKEYKGTLGQSDERFRSSLVKIQTDTPLKPLVIKDSPDPKVGEWVVSIMATGESLNFQKFADVGVVMGILIGEFDIIVVAGLYSSTVAGAPVINLEGELVGILRDGRVYAIHDLRRGVEKLVKASGSQGTVEDTDKERPWLGLIYTVINEDYAESTGLCKSAIWVQHVISNAPGAKAGIKPDDLIIQVDEKPIALSGQRAMAHFHKLLNPEMNRKVSLTVLRSGKQIVVECTFDKRPEPKEFKADDIGVTVQEINDFNYYEKGLGHREGLLVLSIVRGSPAATSSSFRGTLISQGDIITEFYGHPVRTIDDFTKVLDKLRKEKPESVLVKLYRGVRITHAGLNLKIGKK